MHEYIQHRLASNQIILPRIFSFYLDIYSIFHESYMVHYTFLDLSRLYRRTEYSPISNIPPFFDKFTELYNRFNEIIHRRGLFFKSLLTEEESLLSAFDVFVEELAGYDFEDSFELLSCTTELIYFYQDQLILDTSSVSNLLLKTFTWFNLAYLKESSA